LVSWLVGDSPFLSFKKLLGWKWEFDYIADGWMHGVLVFVVTSSAQRTWRGRDFLDHITTTTYYYVALFRYPSRRLCHDPFGRGLPLTY
jgi:hypothetical protein